MNLVLMEKMVALMLLVTSGQPQLGTVFGSSHWDKSNPNSHMACYHRSIDDRRDLVVAHNTLPCRSLVLVVNPRTHLASLARVGDRGPRHAGVDLSPLLAHSIRHNGREEVLLIPLPGPPGPPPPPSQRRARTPRIPNS